MFGAPQCAAKAVTVDGKASPLESSDRARGREHESVRPVCSDGTLPPPEAAMEYGDVSQENDGDVKLHLEEAMDQLSEQYVESIEPDLSMVVRVNDRNSLLPCTGRQQQVGDDESIKMRGAPGQRSGSKRHRASPDDVWTVTELLPGPLAELLPPGTRVRRPPEKLVQLVAQVIHESPCNALRVGHVYTALQNRYPCFLVMSKKEVTVWKSCIRRALNQKWFKKVVLDNKVGCSSERRRASRPNGNFWAVNYEQRSTKWHLPTAPQRGERIKEAVHNDSKFTLQDTRKCPQSQMKISHESPAPLAESSTAMASVWSQELYRTLGLFSRFCSPMPEQRPVRQLSPEAALKPLHYKDESQQQHQEHQSKHLQQHQQHQLQKERQEQQQPPALCPTRFPTPPTPLTPQTPHSGESPAWRLPLPLAEWSDSLEEAPPSTPRSRLSSSSETMSPQPLLQYYLGSDEMKPRHTEEQTQPHGGRGANMEQVAVLPKPSVELLTQQECYTWLENALYGDPDIFNCPSPSNCSELSRGSDYRPGPTYIKEDTETGVYCGMGEPLAPPPFLCSPRLTTDTPAPHVSGDFQLPPPQHGSQCAPKQELRSQQEPFVYPDRFTREQQLMLPRERPLPQGQSLPSRQDFVLRGQWVPGPPSLPWDSMLYDPRSLPVAPYVNRPMYSPLVEPVDVVRTRDGGLYIMSWPRYLDDQSSAFHGRCQLEGC